MMSKGQSTFYPMPPYHTFDPLPPYILHKQSLYWHGRVRGDDDAAASADDDDIGGDGDDDDNEGGSIR